MATKPRVKTFSFGGCKLSGVSPDVLTVSPATPMLNLYMTFEEALKLNLAVQECVRTLNTYNRSTTAGKNTGLNVAVHLQAGRITINEAKL
jgi:hypothetical protein